MLVGAACLAANAVALFPWLFTPGSPQDEGGILAYARLALQGYVPMRDVRSFYGPLNPYVVGGVMWLADWNLYAERLIGLVYRLVIAAALMLLVRHRGPLVVALCGTTLIVLPPTVSLTAAAALGALGAALVALLFAQDRRAASAGVAAGIAVLMRYDWVLPVALLALPWLRVWDHRARFRFIGAFGATVALYLPYLATVGWANITYARRLLQVSQAAHRLPLPALDSSSGMILLLTVVVVPVLLLAGVIERKTAEGTSLQSIALLTVGLFPYAIYSPSRTHVLITGMVALATFATVPRVIYNRLAPKVRSTIGLSFVGTLAIIVPMLLLSVATLDPAPGFAATVDGRSFIMPTAASARAAESAVGDATRLAPHGGSIFVGPRNLAAVESSDAYMYYLLPDLRPASFFVVLDPGITQLAPHNLTHEIARASVLILDNVAPWPEPPSTGQTNRVVAHDFCERRTLDQFSVYTHCGDA